MFSKKSDKTMDREARIPMDRPLPPTQPLPSSLFASRTAAFVNGGGKTLSSIIGADLTIKGNIVSKGEVQVEGEVQGDVNCNCLVVGEKAIVTGGVVAEDVIVRGRVEGTIRAQRVTLQASSHVTGDIHHSTLSMEQGAYFDGKSRRSDTSATTAKSSAAPKASSPPPKTSSPPPKPVKAAS